VADCLGIRCFKLAALRRSANIHLATAKLSVHHSPVREKDDMERRDFLKIALGAVGGAAALAATAQAAPLSPHQIVEDGRRLSATQDAHPAVTNENEVDWISPEEVRWGRHWHHRHWRHGRRW
jgi:hypothetical protein